MGIVGGLEPCGLETRPLGSLSLYCSMLQENVTSMPLKNYCTMLQGNTTSGAFNAVLYQVARKRDLRCVYSDFVPCCRITRPHGH